MNAIKSLVKWMHIHPLISVCAATLFSSLATVMAFRHDWLLPGLITYGVAAIVLGFSICKSKTVGVILILAMLTPVAKAQEVEPKDKQAELAAAPAAGCAAAAVAVVVVCVGGYCIYKIVKFCQRKFPKTPPAAGNPTNIVTSSFSNTQEDVYAASWNFDYMGSCYQYDPCYGDDGVRSLTGPTYISGGTTSLDITMNVDDEGEVNFVTSITCTNGPEATLNWEEFQDEARSLGVVLTGNGDQTQFFAKNGVPIPVNESPIQFNEQQRRVQVHGTGDTAFYTVVIERSDDLIRWDHLLSTEIQPGARFRVDDGVNKGRGFYRMRASLTD